MQDLPDPADQGAGGHLPQERVRRLSMGTIAILGWMMLVLSLYYWVHKPLTPALAEALGGVLLDLASTAAVALVAAGTGQRLLRGFDRSGWSAPERLALAGMLGLGALSMAIAGVGALMLNALSAGLVLGVLGLWSRRDLAAWLREARGWVQGGLPRAGWERGLAWAAVALLGMALALATLPPSKWDTLTYHLAGPQQYVEHGRFYAAPHNHFLGFPQGVETLYAGQLALTGRLSGAGLLHHWMGLLMLMIAGGMAARAGGRAAGWVAVILLLSAYSIWLELTFAYADLLPAAYGLGALAAVQTWDAEGRRSWRWLVLAGALAGMAMGCKYTAIWLGGALGALVLWLGRRDGARASIQRAAIFGAAAALLVLPWLARNAVWYHNPFYPFFFDSGEVDSLRQSWYAQPRSGLIYTSAAWQIPILPLAATVLGGEGKYTYGFEIGPWFVVLTPLVALVWRRLTRAERRTVEQALIVAGVILAAWFVTSAFGWYYNRQTRLILYVFPPLAVIGGLALEALRRLPDKPLNLGFVLRAMLALTVGLSLITAGREVLGSGLERYYSGSPGFRDAYLEHALGWHYEAMRQVNRLPAGTRVHFLWEPRYLYCDQTRIVCVPDSMLDAWYYARRTIGDGSPDAIAAAWRAAGMERLLVYDVGRRFERENKPYYSAGDWDAWDAFVQEHLTVEWQGANEDETIYTLYRWQGS